MSIDHEGRYLDPLWIEAGIGNIGNSRKALCSVYLAKFCEDPVGHLGSRQDRVAFTGNIRRATAVSNCRSDGSFDGIGLVVKSETMAQ